jgi:hypothetical protein
MSGLEKLEMRIRELEEKVEEMREATREANMTLRDMKIERREVERLLSMGEIKKLIDDRVGEVVKTELDRIGPEIREHTKLIYNKVGEQIDKLIGLSLGKELSIKGKNADLRPRLAERMKFWIREIMQSEGLEWEEPPNVQRS